MERLVGLRKSRHLTQKQVAEGVNITEVAVQNYESGRRKPNYDTLIALANFFNVPLDFLVGRGIYQNWDLVMKYKEQVVDALIQEFDELDIPLMPKQYILSLSEKDFIEIFRSMVEYIDIQEKETGADVVIELRPMSEIFSNGQ